MTRRLKIWLAVIALFLAINLGGLVMAVASWELPHAGLHAALALAAAWALGRIAARRIANY